MGTMTLFREMFGELSAWGRFWLYLGLATLVCAAAMSFAFGMEISLKHALFLMCLTAIAAFLPEAAYSQWEQGRKIVAGVLALVAVPTLTIEFYTHAGYTAGLRGSNIETAQVQNAKYATRQDSVSESKTDLALWRKRLADLEAQNAWVGTVTADALRAQLASANLAIEQEAARGGCKAKCLARTKERDDLASKIAIAEEKSDLTKKIEATRRVVDTARDVAATTEFKSSAVQHQNDFLAKTVALVSAGSLKPSEIMTEGAQQTVNLAMALAGTGLPALALFIAGLYRRREDHDHTAQHATAADVSAAGTNPQAHVVPPAFRAQSQSIADLVGAARLRMAA